jgi:hypothetical protein
MIGIRRPRDQGRDWSGADMLSTVTVRSQGLRAILGFVVAASLVACASTGQTTTRSLDVVTGDEVRETGSSNLYFALRTIRPQWLRTRAASSLVRPRAEEPVVYVEGVRRGAPDVLLEITLELVRQVEFLSAAEATTRFGTGHGGGAILVSFGSR